MKPLTREWNTISKWFVRTFFLHCSPSFTNRKISDFISAVIIPALLGHCEDEKVEFECKVSTIVRVFFPLTQAKLAHQFKIRYCSRIVFPVYLSLKYGKECFTISSNLFQMDPNMKCIQILGVKWTGENVLSNLTMVLGKNNQEGRQTCPNCSE